MQLKHLVFTIGLAGGLVLSSQPSQGADKEAMATPMEKTFITKAANGGMAEVELGKLAAEKGASDAVKDFGNQMVKDHSKANDNLKEVASKLGATVPAKIDAMHQATIEKMSGMSGAAFDTAYVKEMIKDHKKDIAEFDTADKAVKNADLKKFIEDTVPVMKEHLTMIEKFDQAK